MKRQAAPRVFCRLCERALKRGEGAMGLCRGCAMKGAPTTRERELHERGSVRGRGQRRGNPPRLTRDVAWAAAHDAGSRSMRAAGRIAWNEDDYNAAVAEFNRLWPYENPGGPHASKMRRCIESVSRDPGVTDPGAVCAASVMPGRRRNPASQPCSKCGGAITMRRPTTYRVTGDYRLEHAKCPKRKRRA